MSIKSKNKGIRQRRGMLFIYIAFMLVLSASIVLMPFGVEMAEKTMAVTYISGALFWGGLAGAVTMAAIITCSRCRSDEFGKLYPNHKRLGLIHFFGNIPAVICDILMFISLVGFIITNVLMGTTIWPFIFLSLLIFSFGMHCMLNGSNYVYINYKIKENV